MIVAGYSHSFLTYVWHYLLARLLYDDLLRPLARGDAIPVLATLAGVSLAALLVGRRRRRRS